MFLLFYHFPFLKTILEGDVKRLSMSNSVTFLAGLRAMGATADARKVQAET